MKHLSFVLVYSTVFMIAACGDDRGSFGLVRCVKD